MLNIQIVYYASVTLNVKFCILKIVQYAYIIVIENIIFTEFGILPKFFNKKLLFWIQMCYNKHIDSLY